MFTLNIWQIKGLFQAPASKRTSFKNTTRFFLSPTSSFSTYNPTNNHFTNLKCFCSVKFLSPVKIWRVISFCIPLKFLRVFIYLFSILDGRCKPSCRKWEKSWRCKANKRHGWTAAAGRWSARFANQARDFRSDGPTSPRFNEFCSVDNSKTEHFLFCIWL